MRSTLNNFDSPKLNYDRDEGRKLDLYFSGNPVPPNKNENQGKTAVQNIKDNAIPDKKNRNAAPGLTRKKICGNDYASRIQMDRQLARPEFRIKSYWQVFLNRISFFTPPPDKVCGFFVTKRLPEICDTLEQLITAVRLIFPRNDHEKNTNLCKHSPFSYNVLDVIRRWNISRITTRVGLLQSHSRNISISHLAQLLRLIYRPIFILHSVDADKHFPFILDNLYRQFTVGSSRAVNSAAREQTFKRITYLYEEVTREICYALYPLLMKMFCKKWCNYDTFIIDYSLKIYQFLGIKEGECIIPPKHINIEKNRTGENTVFKNAATDKTEENSGEELENQRLKKVMQSGLETLEILFPSSGWYQPESFPDFYPYFTRIFDFKKGVDCLHPQNPVLQIFVLAQIVRNLFYGWRSMIIMPDNRNNSPLKKLVFDWQEGFEELVYRDYLKLLHEYYSHFSLGAEFRKDVYGRKISTEINFFTKESILPFHDYSLSDNIDFPQKKHGSIFNKIGALYHELDKIAVEPNETAYIGHRSAPFVFDIPNPVSRRLFSLFDARNRSNQILITITHEITAVLHYLINCPDSWAYSVNNEKKIFRSQPSPNTAPVDGLDPDDLFRRSLERLRLQAKQKFKDI